LLLKNIYNYKNPALGVCLFHNVVTLMFYVKLNINAMILMPQFRTDIVIDFEDVLWVYVYIERFLCSGEMLIKKNLS
jgi:hypothetical protein